MTLAQQAARNRANLEHKAGLKHDPRFDYVSRREHHTLLLVLAVLISGAFWLSMDAIAMLEEGAKPGQILAKSEMTKAEIKALHIIGTVAEKRGSNGR